MPARGACDLKPAFRRSSHGIQRDSRRLSRRTSDSHERGATRQANGLSPRVLRLLLHRHSGSRSRDLPASPANRRAIPPGSRRHDRGARGAAGAGRSRIAPRSGIAFAQRTGDEFLDRPAIRNAPEPLEDAAVTRLDSGARLGPNGIETKLGEGGMGRFPTTSRCRARRSSACSENSIPPLCAVRRTWRQGGAGRPRRNSKKFSIILSSL